MGQTYIDLYIRHEVTLFVVLFFIATMIMLPRQLLGVYFHHQIRRGKLFMQHPLTRATGVTLFEPIYLEDPEVLHEALAALRASLEKWADKYAIICIVDAADVYPKEGGALAEIAEQYGAHVFMTNARSKRKNLRNAVEWAKKHGVLYEFSAFHDSDTVPTTPDHNIIGELLRPFVDERVGGVTTAQRIRNPNHWLLRILDWLEDARIGGSMAAGSLFGQVGCLPGRLYMVRSCIIADWMDELVEEYWKVPTYSFKWPFVSIARVQAHAGDDRRMTLRVEELGYRTVMNPRATVETTLPKKLRQINRIFRRWATSSQWLTFRYTGKSWFWRLGFVMYQYYTDLLLTLISVFLVVRMGYLAIWGEAGLAMPLWMLLAYSVAGVLLTFTVRQLWHLLRHPSRLLLLPVFVVLVTFWQFIRFQALFTPGRISVWGSRKGADLEKGKVWFRPFEKFRKST